jgi:hypothetical protein
MVMSGRPRPRSQVWHVVPVCVSITSDDRPPSPNDSHYPVGSARQARGDGIT